VIRRIPPPLVLNKTAREALEIFKGLLRGKSLSVEDPVFDQTLIFLTRPGIHQLPEAEKAELTLLMKKAFGLSELQLYNYLTEQEIEGTASADPNLASKAEAAKAEAELRSLIPVGGFLDQYAEFTSNSEAPLAYHIFCALVAVGLVVNRNIWFDMGYYRLYPPLAVFLLGPSGLRKTSATNIMVKMIQDIEITKVYPEKLTPEVLVGAVKDNPHGLLYGPEMASTLGKQKYLEGLIPLITRLQDCPDVYLAETIGRGKELLRDVAISVLMCSTPDWFVSNTPADTFGGGFIARNIMVMQNDTPREEDIPTPQRKDIRESLVTRLIELQRNLKGPLVMTPQARAFHKEWYHHHREKTKHPEHPLLGTYYQRKPDHMKKLGMCLHVVEHDSLEISLSSLEQAIAICDWAEKFIPPMLTNMFKTQIGEQAQWVMGLIRNAGGMIRHAELVRKVSHKFNAQTLRTTIGTLKEAEQLTELQTTLQHIYVLRRSE
jgi:hypothetical protein